MPNLVVYFSRKGYTKKLAEEMAKRTHADLYEVKTKERIKGILGFWWCGRFGMHRWEMPIETVTLNLESYDTVIICSPIWVFTVCAPILAFLKQASGRVKKVEYVLVHFSNPRKYPNTIKKMDQILGVEHSKYTSVRCMYGRCKLQ